MVRILECEAPTLVTDAGIGRCLCAGRWKEAFDARERYGDAIVPKVLLEATHREALVGLAQQGRLGASTDL